MRVFSHNILVITGCKDTQSYYIYPCGIEIDDLRVDLKDKEVERKKLNFRRN